MGEKTICIVNKANRVLSVEDKTLIPGKPDYWTLEQYTEIVKCYPRFAEYVNKGDLLLLDVTKDKDLIKQYEQEYETLREEYPNPWQADEDKKTKSLFARSEKRYQRGI